MPVILEMAQGSEEWYQARREMPTASCFDKIVTPTGRPAKTNYMDGLLAEGLTGQSDSTFMSKWMKRGKELEAEARTAYEFLTNQDVRCVGFVTRDDGMCGCSPDGLVGDDGGIEIKCPSPHIHVGYLRANAVPGIYYPQIQGSMWVCERGWWDFLSYHPDMKPLIIRVERDEAYIEKLSAGVLAFAQELRIQKKLVRA